jgi:hypothetical protein
MRTTSVLKPHLIHTHRQSESRTPKGQPKDSITVHDITPVYVCAYVCVLATHGYSSPTHDSTHLYLSVLCTLTLVTSTRLSALATLVPSVIHYMKIGPARYLR